MYFRQPVATAIGKGLEEHYLAVTMPDTEERGIVQVNIRYAVLCERLKARTRLRGGQPQPGATTDEQLLTVEEKLGFRLPEMLRTLYLANSPADLYGLELEEVWRPEGWRSPKQSDETAEGGEPAILGLAPEVIEALRQEPGSYISLGEDGIPCYLPDSFLQLVISQIYGNDGVMLDGHTGYLYFDAPDYRWTHLSFAAPSFEDWLERELDGGYRVQVRYQPQKEKKLAIVLEEGWIRLAAGPRPVLGLLQQPAVDPVEARRETMRFREETLHSAGPDPLDREVDREIHMFQALPSRLPYLRQVYDKASIERVERMLERYEQDPDEVRDELRAQIRQQRATDGDFQVKQSGWRLEGVRLQLLRELYALMAVLEAEQDELRDEGEEERSNDGETFLEGLGPVIEADAQLALLYTDMVRGASKLRGRELPHRIRRHAVLPLVALSAAGRYVEADTRYEQRLAEAPEAAELWLGRAENEQSWAESEAKAERKTAARAHFALAVRYAQQARTLNPKNRRYVRVLASIQQAVDALDN